MTTVLLVIHIIIAMAMVGIILLQKNEGGGPAIGGGTMGGFMSARSAANLLTHTTAILATCFFLSSLGLAIVFKGRNKAGSILDTPAASVPVAPVKSETQSPPVSPALPKTAVSPVSVAPRTVPVKKEIKKEEKKAASKPLSSSDKENK